MASAAPDLKSRVRAKTEHDNNVHRQLERALLEHRKAFPRGKDAKKPSEKAAPKDAKTTDKEYADLREQFWASDWSELFSDIKVPLSLVYGTHDAGASLSTRVRQGRLYAQLPSHAVPC